ncbi:metalloendopeptidase [Coemansia sp. RSA 1935]|nr:metalloendopeptidase [Coemansia sp. RSA 1935]
MEDLLNDDINFKQNANEIVPGAYCLADKFKVVLFKITRSGTWKPPHFTLKSRMAKTPENVLHMLKDLQEKLTPLAKIELDTLVALKETDMENLGKPFIGFYRWDFNELVDSITLIGRGDLSTHRVSMFTHMCGNYDSKYYTYIWSQIHAADMFASRFMKDGLDNPQTGRDYRNEILRPGSSRDPMINLKQFLGRMPNSKAFLKSVGLE